MWLGLAPRQHAVLSKRPSCRQVVPTSRKRATVQPCNRDGARVLPLGPGTPLYIVAPGMTSFIMLIAAHGDVYILIVDETLLRHTLI